MQPLTIKQRGTLEPALVVRGQMTIAEVFTDREPGDQYQTAALDTGGIAQARAAIARATGADHA